MDRRRSFHARHCRGEELELTLADVLMCVLGLNDGATQTECRCFRLDVAALGCLRHAGAGVGVDEPVELGLLSGKEKRTDIVQELALAIRDEQRVEARGESRQIVARAELSQALQQLLSLWRPTVRKQ